MKFYGKTLMFRRGTNVTLFLSYKCNIYCPYCSLAQVNGKYPVGKELTLDEWKEWFNVGFPVKIREVYLSGGEPSLVPYIVELTNFLLDKGYHVLLFSNLARVDRLEKIKKSYRFYVRATYHHVDDKERFDKAYQRLIKTHPVIVDEFEYKVLPYSRVKNDWGTIPFWKVPAAFRVGCDGSLYKSIFDHVTSMTKKSDLIYEDMCESK